MFTKTRLSGVFLACLMCLTVVGLSNAAGPPPHAKGKAKGIASGNAAPPANGASGAASNKTALCHVEGGVVELLWLSDGQLQKHATHQDDFSPPQFYLDEDGDGFGNGAALYSGVACVAPTGTSDNILDCDDQDPGVNPFAQEVLNNGKDDDCDPSTLDVQAAVCPCLSAYNALPIDLATWGPQIVMMSDPGFDQNPCMFFDASDSRPRILAKANRFNEFDPFVWEYQTGYCAVDSQNPAADVQILNLTAEEYEACGQEVERIGEAVAAIPGMNVIRLPDQALTCEPATFYNQ